jgi:hypothetical protein
MPEPPEPATAHQPLPQQPSVAAIGTRPRSLLASLAKLIESPPPRVVIVDADGATTTTGMERTGQRSPQRAGYEAPVHVGYLPAQRPSAPSRAASVTRRFALLDEIAVDTRRFDRRRSASRTPSN